MNKYRVWDPNNGDEDDAQVIEASSTVYAATKYAEEHDSDCDYAFTNAA